MKKDTQTISRYSLYLLLTKDIIQFVTDNFPANTPQDNLCDFFSK